MLARRSRCGFACSAAYGNGGPVDGRSQDHPCPRTSVARPVCHQCCCHAVTTTITVAAGSFAPGHLGELTRIVPFELADAVLEEAGAAGAAAAAAAVAGRDLLRAGDVPVPAAWLPGGMGQAHSGAGRRWAWLCRRRRRCGTCGGGSAPRRCGGCSRSWPGRWDSRARPGSCSAGTGRFLRRLQVDQGPRYRAEPGLLGKHERVATGETGYPASVADDPGGDRAPGRCSARSSARPADGETGLGAPAAAPAG